MEFRLDEARAILERSPKTIRALLQGLPAEWLNNNEGGDSWSPIEIVAHLIHVEQTEWLTRTQIIIEHGESLPFHPFVQAKLYDVLEGKSLDQLLDQFELERRKSLESLHDLHLVPDDLARTGKHPVLGVTTLKELLSAWVVHDLNHIHHIAQTMSRQYRDHVGVFRPYMAVLDD